MEFRKLRLPKGRSYPLKPSALAEAVEQAGLRTPVRLLRWDYPGSNFSARFEIGGWVSWRPDDCFAVSVNAAEAHNSAFVREAVERIAIPRFINWAKEIERLEPNSTRWLDRAALQFDFEYPTQDDPEGS